MYNGAAALLQIVPDLSHVIVVARAAAPIEAANLRQLLLDAGLHVTEAGVRRDAHNHALDAQVAAPLGRRRLRLLVQLAEATQQWSAPFNVIDRNVRRRGQSVLQPE